MIVPKPSEVWYAHLPKEENRNEIMRDRPCIIVDQVNEEFLVIKVTKHDPRESDPYDVDIIDWQKCGLKLPSTARISKIQYIDRSQIDNYKGRLEETDEKRISEMLEKYLNEN